MINLLSTTDDHDIGPFLTFIYFIFFSTWVYSGLIEDDVEQVESPEVNKKLIEARLLVCEYSDLGVVELGYEKGDGSS